MADLCPTARIITEVICTTRNGRRYHKVRNYEVHSSKAHVRRACSSHVRSLSFYDTSPATPSAYRIPTPHFSTQKINHPTPKNPLRPRRDISRTVSHSPQLAPQLQCRIRAGVLHHPINVHQRRRKKGLPLQKSQRWQIWIVW